LLQRWHERLSQRGRGTVLGVDALDVTDDALDFVREFDLSYPMLKDSDEEVYPGYGVVQFPETFVIDAKGRIASIRRGPVDDEFMRDEVLPLTKEGA
jgi:cytochrome c biogenesis protein CcmG/thiol:disulfide interchange protein DsbE